MFRKHNTFIMTRISPELPYYFTPHNITVLVLRNIDNIVVCAHNAQHAIQYTQLLLIAFGNTYTMSFFKIVLAVWLYYFLDGIISVGVVKVEVKAVKRTKPEEQQQQKRQNSYFRSVVSQTGLWTGTISEKLYITKNAIQTPKRLLPHANEPELINIVSINRGTVNVFYIANTRKPQQCGRT